MLYRYCDKIRFEKGFDDIWGKLDCNISKKYMMIYLFFLATFCSVQPVCNAWCDM